jgi:3-mercaptopyruvate sulfurtransferase SseA
LALLAVVAFLPRLVRRVRGRRFTDPAILKRGLESGEEVVLIDVRSAEEFRGPLGHIAGASNIPIAELSAKIRELTEIKRKPIITI